MFVSAAEAWINCSSIVIHKALVLDRSLQYVQFGSFAEILQIVLFFSIIWYCQVQSPAVSKRQYVRWCNFGWSIPLSIDRVWESSFDKVISTPSWSCCICNRYCQNHRLVLPNLIMIVWFYTVDFNRLTCSSDKLYDDVVFADRFRYPLTMSGNRVMKRLSRLLHAHIAYAIDTAKIIAAFCRISHCLHDLIQLHSIVCHVQTTSYTII